MRDESLFLLLTPARSFSYNSRELVVRENSIIIRITVPRWLLLYTCTRGPNVDRKVGKRKLSCVRVVHSEWKNVSHRSSNERKREKE